MSENRPFKSTTLQVDRPIKFKDITNKSTEVLYSMTLQQTSIQ